MDWDARVLSGVPFTVAEIDAMQQRAREREQRAREREENEMEEWIVQVTEEGKDWRVKLEIKEEEEKEEEEEGG